MEGRGGEGRGREGRGGQGSRGKGLGRGWGGESRVGDGLTGWACPMPCLATVHRGGEGEGRGGSGSSQVWHAPGEAELLLVDDAVFIQESANQPLALPLVHQPNLTELLLVRHHEVPATPHD